MIGRNCHLNKIKNKKQNMKKASQSGQILLIVILLSAILLTTALSLSQISTQETRVAKLEEESKKAFAAAEAGIEARLKSDSNINIASILPGGSGIISGEATMEEISKPNFVTPVLRKDEAYTFYLANYDKNYNSFNNYFSGYLTFYLTGSSSSCPALELNIISNNNTITRKLIDPCDQVAGDLDSKISTQDGSFNLEGTTFNYRTSASIPINNTKLIIGRVLFAETKIGIEASVSLPPQGKTFTSSATTSTGVSKKIQLFQSYPQIPTEFFVTSF